MITNTPHNPVVSTDPPVRLTEATTLYFDARMTRPNLSSLQRDSRALSALDQMFAYYEA